MKTANHESSSLLPSPLTTLYVVKYLLLLFVILPLYSCQTVPLPVGHGHVELDENTDPRFSKTEDETTIGTVRRTKGSNVYLNNRRIGQSARIKNNDKVHTGPGSLASINFNGLLFAECPQGIRIDEFNKGKLLGKTHVCRHYLTTGNGVMTTDKGHTEYHIHTFPNYTELTVINGAAFINPSADAGARIRVDGGHELKLEGARVIGPRRLSHQEISERISWSKSEVPEVIGLTLKEAVRRLDAAKLKMGNVSYVDSSDSKKTNRVQRQSPSQGSRVAHDTPVQLWVWKKPAQRDTAPDLVSVPKLVGLSLKQAEVRLKRARLNMGSVETIKNDGQHDPQTIARQSPAGGTQLAPNSPVKLWIWNYKMIY